MSTPKTVQSSFTGPIQRSREVLSRCTNQYAPETVICAVSGGTDSVVAADVMARIGPEYGLGPDVVTHINTGASIPQTELVARTVAGIHGLYFHKETYRNPQDSLAGRVLGKGWPGGYQGSPVNGGHGLEWANRKQKPMEEVYMAYEGMQVWASGARKLESKKRQGTLPDSGIEQDKPRRVWCSVIGGWTEAEKRRYIRERGLPVSETYLFLGFSGECVACSYDNKGLLTGIDLLCPELAHAIRSLAVWLYQRLLRGDVDLAPKRLCWGWQPGGTMEHQEADATQAMVGCDPESCGGDVDTQWIQELPSSQIVTRQDVLDWWSTGEKPTRFPV